MSDREFFESGDAEQRRRDAEDPGRAGMGYDPDPGQVDDEPLALVDQILMTVPERDPSRPLLYQLRRLLLEREIAFQEARRTLVELEGATRLLVIGKRGETADTAHEHLGSNLERVIRSLHCPMLITPPGFTAPKRIVVAFDGSRTSKAMIERIAASPLFADVVCHLVFVGEASDECRKKLDDAKAALDRVCAQVTIAVLDGEVEASLRAYEQSNDIDMLVMGAYGHSRIRHLLVGSTTTEMIRRATLPVLILR